MAFGVDPGKGLYPGSQSLSRVLKSKPGYTLSRKAHKEGKSGIYNLEFFVRFVPSCDSGFNILIVFIRPPRPGSPLRLGFDSIDALHPLPPSLSPVINFKQDP